VDIVYVLSILNIDFIVMKTRKNQRKHRKRGGTGLNSLMKERNYRTRFEGVSNYTKKGLKFTGTLAGTLAVDATCMSLCIGLLYASSGFSLIVPLLWPVPWLTGMFLLDSIYHRTAVKELFRDCYYLQIDKDELETTKADELSHDEMMKRIQQIEKPLTNASLEKLVPCLLSEIRRIYESITKDRTFSNVPKFYKIIDVDVIKEGSKQKALNDIIQTITEKRESEYEQKRLYYDELIKVLNMCKYEPYRDNVIRELLYDVLYKWKKIYNSSALNKKPYFVEGEEIKDKDLETAVSNLRKVTDDKKLRKVTHDNTCHTFLSELELYTRYMKSRTEMNDVQKRDSIKDVIDNSTKLVNTVKRLIKNLNKDEICKHIVDFKAENASLNEEAKIVTRIEELVEKYTTEREPIIKELIAYRQGQTIHKDEDSAYIKKTVQELNDLIQNTEKKTLMQNMGLYMDNETKILKKKQTLSQFVTNKAVNEPIFSVLKELIGSTSFKQSVNDVDEETLKQRTEPALVKRKSMWDKLPFKVPSFKMPFFGKSKPKEALTDTVRANVKPNNPEDAVANKPANVKPNNPEDATPQNVSKKKSRFPFFRQNKRAQNVTKKSPMVEKKSPTAEKKSPTVEKKSPTVEKKSPTVESESANSTKLSPNKSKTEKARKIPKSMFMKRRGRTLTKMFKPKKRIG